MKEIRSTGIYLYNPEQSSESVAFFKLLESFVKTLPGVVVVWNSIIHDHCDECIPSSLEKLEIDRMVIIGKTPGR